MRLTRGVLPRQMLAAVITTLAGNFCHAKKVPGYIVNQIGDTLRGRIRLPDVNQVTLGYSVSGFIMMPLHERVVFKDYGKHRFETFSPE